MKSKDKSTSDISRRKFLAGAAAFSGIMILPRYVLGGKGFLAPSDRITLGYIGCGRQAITLNSRFANTDSQVVSVCDVYKNKATIFARNADKFYSQKYGTSGYTNCTTHSNFMDLLERKDIDAVVIATPDHWHAAIAVRAAAEGKDIYSEKPLSLTVAEGRAMVKAVRKHGRIFQTGSMQRSSKEFRQCVELIRNGYIGELKHVKVSIGGPPVPYNLPKEEVPADLDWNMWLGPNEYVHYNHLLNPVIGDPVWGKWRDYKGLGGGDMTDWGAHMFDIAQWAMDMDNSGPIEVFVPGTGEYTNLTYKYANGTLMTHEDFGRKHALQFIGSEGIIEVQRGKLTVPPNLTDQVIGGNDKRVYYSDNHYSDFLTAIKSRKTPIVDVETGHRSATVCNIGNIAFELNKSLKWNPSKERFTDKEANSLLSRKMRKEWKV